jgi:hypothetical protein
MEVQDEPRPKPRRRNRKFLLVLLGLLVLALVFAPRLAAPLVHGQLESALGERLRAEVSIGALGLGWGSASLRDVRVADAGGRQHAYIESATASAPLLAALRGSYAPTIRVAHVELDLERDAQGRWSFEDLLPAPEERADEDEPAAREGSASSPFASAHVEVEHLLLRVKSPEGRGTFELTELTAVQADADAPLVIDATGGLRAAGAGGAELASTYVLGARFDFSALSFNLALEGALLSGTASGKLRVAADPLTAEGLRADLRYVPDDIATLLGSLLPVELSGAATEELTLDYTGALAATDVASLLSAGEGKLSVGLGQLAFAGVRTGGHLGLDLKGGAAQLTGSLGLSGGALTLAGGHSPDGGLSLSIVADAVRSTAAIAPLLETLHPAFASLDRLEGTGLAGLLSGRLDLAWDGELPLAPPEGGWAALPLERLTGSGRVEIGDASLQSSPFVGQLLNAFGQEATRKVSMQPLAFSLSGSRLRYDEPWSWNVGGAATTFQGSVGFDKGLDLAWTVPVTEHLASKAGVAQLAGKTLVLPIRGTVLAPKLDWGAALQDLAAAGVQDAAREKLQDALDEKLGEVLGEHAGGGGQAVKDIVEAALGGGGGSDDPEAILKRADELYGQGKRAEAAPLYQRLYDDFKLTTAYQLNKSRIKDRRKVD